MCMCVRGRVYMYVGARVGVFMGAQARALQIFSFKQELYIRKCKYTRVHVYFYTYVDIAATGGDTRGGGRD